MNKIIELLSNEEAVKLYGSLDENLRFAEDKFNVKIYARNRKLTISGSKTNVEKAYDFFMQLLEDIRAGRKPLSGEASRDEKTGKKEAIASGRITFSHKGKTIQAKSKNQEDYLRAVMDYDIVMSIGPAGTGKTYLAMALALDFLRKKKVSRIILTRPAVEAGESLGYLPGDLYAKINPYLRPLYDALYDMMEVDEISKNIQKGVIEVAPLAYMRGRTLNDSFVILDEAQNTTHEQMMMFLTRLGFSSKIIITGDITQIDLPRGKISGLIEARDILRHIEGIKFIYLTEKDVVRHRLVQHIIKAYEKHIKLSG